MTNSENNKKGFLGKFFDAIKEIPKILKLLPRHQRFFALLALLVFFIVVLSIIFIGESYIVLYGICFFIFIALVFVVCGSYRTTKKGIGQIEKKIDRIPKEKGKVVEFLKGVTINASRTLKIPNDELRSNVFMPDPDEGSVLKIPEGLYYNMNDPVERTIRIPSGYGCTGNAFSNKEPTIAILKKDWGKYILDDEEMEKVNKRLVWIVSIPILFSKIPGKVIGVLNVDCLDMKKEKEELEEIVNDMWCWTNLISSIL